MTEERLLCRLYVAWIRVQVLDRGADLEVRFFII